MVDNKYQVSKRQWKKWNEQEQYLFNSIYDQMTSMPFLFMHPRNTSWFKDEEDFKQAKSWDWFKTTAWNAAWIAADDLRWLRKGFK